MGIIGRAAAAAAVVALSVAGPVGLAQAQAPGSAAGGTTIGPVSIDFGPGTGALTLSKSNGLKTGDSVTVHGQGYKPNAPIYIAETVAKPPVGFPMTYAQESKVTADANGAFTATVDVVSNFKGVDCLQGGCFIASFAAFPSIFTDRSQDVWQPISFGADSGRANEGSGAAPGSGGPVTTVSRTSDLNPNGDTVHVSGTGFSAAGAGLYVGLAEVDRYSTTDADAFINTVFLRSNEINGGAWSLDLPVQARNEHGDCTVNACAIYTLAAHGSPDRSQDTKTPVSFAATPITAPAPAQSNAAPAQRFASGPVVSLSKTAGLNAAGDSITVSGSGFAAKDPGVYVGLAQANQYSTTNADAFYDPQWVRASEISADGHFTKTIPVTAKFGSADCTVNACAVYTFAAHGSSDRSQDTATPVSFVGTARAAAATVPGPGAGHPMVTAAKSTDIAKSGETVQVSGSGFSGQNPGIYVGLVQDDRYSPTDESSWLDTKYLPANLIHDGAWSTDLDLNPIKGDLNCLTNACSIRTVMAHGSSDRSQDTMLPVSYGDAVVAQNASSDSTPVDAAASTDAIDDSGSSATGWIVGGVIAAIVVFGGGVAVAMRRRA